MAEADAQPRQWHHLTVQNISEVLYGNIQPGLTDEEAEARLIRDGPNSLPPPKRTPLWLKFLLQFHSSLIYMLILVMIFCFATKQIVYLSFILSYLSLSTVHKYCID